MIQRVKKFATSKRLIGVLETGTIASYYCSGNQSNGFDLNSSENVQNTLPQEVDKTQNLSDALMKLFSQNNHTEERVSSLLHLYPISTLKFKEISKAFHLLGQWRHYDEAFCNSINSILSERIFSQFDLKQYSQIIWSLAIFNYSKIQSLQQIMLQVQHWVKQKKCSPQEMQELVQLMWGLTILQCWAPQSFWIETSNKISVAELGLKFQSQLFHAHMLQSNLNSKNYTGCILPNSDDRKALQKVWTESQKTQHKSVSEFQFQVFEILQRLGLNPLLEQKLLKGHLSIDISFEKNGRKYAVEVDGPDHFTSNKPYKITGKTFVRNQLVESAGWYVIQVPHFEWSKTKNKQDYLEDLLIENEVL